MWIALLFGLAPATLPDGPAIDVDQFTRMMPVLYAPIHDISFVFEGEVRFVGPASLPEQKGKKPEDFGQRFQGAYALRSDKAALLDVYYRGFPELAPFVHDKLATLGNGKFEILGQTPDLKRGRDAKRVENGSLSRINVSRSPQSFYYLWYFLNNIYTIKVKSKNYQFLGWENVDGNRCLRVRIAAPPGLGPIDRGDYTDFSIDLERGGHPLRVESYEKSRLFTRLSGVELRQFPTPDGKKVWLPVRGRRDSFVWEHSVPGFDIPIFSENQYMVDGSLRINQGLPDSFFSVDEGRGFEGTAASDRLRGRFASLSLRREFEALPPPPPFRTDPAGVRERLERQLAEADRQAKVLDASSEARAATPWTLILQTILVVAGVACLGGALAWRWRGR